MRLMKCEIIIIDPIQTNGKFSTEISRWWGKETTKITLDTVLKTIRERLTTTARTIDLLSQNFVRDK